MKLLRILLLFILSSLECVAQYSNDDFSGKWISSYRTKADGSKVIEPNHQLFIFNSLEFISSNELILSCYHQLNISRDTFKYSVNKDTFFISDKKYKIDYFKHDSLIIIELHSPNEYSISQPFKYYYEWEPLKLKSETNLTTDTFIAPIYFGPYLKRELSEIIINQLYQEFENDNLKFNLIINTQDKSLKIKTKGKIKNYAIIGEVNNDISNLYDEVSINFPKKYSTIIVPLIIKKSIYQFDKNYISKYSLEYDISRYYTEKEQPSYNDEVTFIKYALEDYNKGKLKRAVSYFIKANKANPYNPETMMNIAAIYYELGQKDKACEWWKKLKDLGQVEGAKRFDYYCK